MLNGRKISDFLYHWEDKIMKYYKCLKMCEYIISVKGKPTISGLEKFMSKEKAIEYLVQLSKFTSEKVIEIAEKTIKKIKE